MIASRLAGFNVKGTEPAQETTPEQAALQREIADAFDQLEMNRLDDPDVARARHGSRLQSQAVAF